LILASIPIPLPGEHLVMCEHCGRTRSVTAAEYPQIRETGRGRRSLYYLQTLNPEAADRIVKDIASGKAAEADLLSLVAQAWEPAESQDKGPLTVAEAEAQLRAKRGEG
jgi:hypothetical protein